MQTDIEKVTPERFIEDAMIDERAARALSIYDVRNNAQALWDGEIDWERVDAEPVDGFRELIEACQRVVAVDVRL